MNKIYRSIWNESLGAWVATSEISLAHSSGHSVTVNSVNNSSQFSTRIKKKTYLRANSLFQLSSVFLALLTATSLSYSQNICGDVPLSGIVICNGDNNPVTDTTSLPDIFYTDPVFLTIDASLRPITLNGVVSIYSEGTTPVSIDVKGKVTQKLEYTSQSVGIGQYESYLVPHSIKINVGPEVKLDNSYLSPTGVFYNIAAKVDNNEIDIASGAQITSIATNPIESIASPMYHAGILGLDPTGGNSSKITIVNTGNIALTSEGGKGGLSSGIFAISDGLGSLNTVSIENTGAISVNNTPGTSTLTGAGIWAGNPNTGGIFINNQSNISSTGDWKNIFYGIKASSINGNITINSGNINLKSVGPSRGVQATSGKKVTINVTGDIYALGEKTTSVGVFIEPATINELAVGSYEINVSPGKVIRSNGMAIGVNSPEGGSITLEKNTVVGNFDQSTDNYAIFTHIGKDIINSKAFITGIIDTNAGDDKLNLTEGALKGSVLMGSGSDELVLSGSFNSEQVSLLDGQEGDDVLVLKGAQASFTGERLSSWETIQLTENADLTLAGGELTLDTLSYSDDKIRGISIDSSSTLRVPKNFILNSNLINSGTITLASTSVGHIFTINGDYKGNNGWLLLNAQLNGDNSLSDKLVVNGNTSGSTTVKVFNVAGLGAKTNKGIEVIKVTGNSDGVFLLASPVQSGVWEYLLNKKGNNWYLDSSYYPEGKIEDNSLPKSNGIASPSPISPSGSLSDTPVTGSLAPTPQEPPRIYRPGISAYVLSQNLTNEMLSLSSGSLQERLGEQYNAQIAACLPQSENDKDIFSKDLAWGRYSVSSVNLSGLKQFEFKSEISLVQLGKDIQREFNATNLSWQQKGVFVNLASSDADTANRVRQLAKLDVNTGQIKTRQIGIGAYITHYDKNGGYLNWVSQINQFDSQFVDIYGDESQQKATSLGVSLDWGKPQKLGRTKWLLEPQAQAQYYVTAHNAFKDSYSQIDSYFAQSARLRLGTRLTWNSQAELPTSETDQLKQNTFYATASIAKELLSNAVVNVSGTKVSDDTSDSPWIELGVGGQIPIFDNAYIFGQIQAQKNLGGPNRSALSGHLGFRFNW